MRSLQGFLYDAEMGLAVDPLLEPDLPEPSVVPVGRVLGPQMKDDIRGLFHHGAVRRRVDTEELQVRENAARAEAQVETSVGQVVQEGQARGHVGGMVVGQARGRGTQPDRVGHWPGPCR